MKKLLAALALCAACAVGAFAQDRPATDTGVLPLNLRSYSACFENGTGGYMATKYAKKASETDFNRIATISGDDTSIDTPLEIALLSYYSQPIVESRPVDAQAMLPARNKTSETQLAAWSAIELAVLRFTNPSSPSIGKYEGILHFIKGRQTDATSDDITPNEINAAVRDIVSAAVDTEFSKPGKEGIIPVDIYADWESRGFTRDASGRPVNGTELIKKTLTDFFLSPTETNYVKVRGIIARIGSQEGNHDPLYDTVDLAWGNMLSTLSPALRDRIENDFPSSSALYACAKQPADVAFNVFSIPYVVGGNR